MATLNTTTSIVDFLKSQGKASDFSSRNKLYRESGLEDRLGSYTGSLSQNTAFLKALQVPVTTPAPAIPAQTPQAASAVPSPVTPAPVTEAVPQQSASGAVDALSALGIPEVPTVNQLTESVLNAPSFDIFRRKQEAGQLIDAADAAAKKESLQSKFLADKKTFEETLGRRGLFMSGQTQTGIQALAESLTASKLDVDRELAGKLLQSDLNLESQIVSDVEKILKDAQSNRKDAISALEKVGLTVIGNQIVPTLAARSAERAERAAEDTNQRFLLAQQAIQDRFEVSQQATQERFDRVQERLAKTESDLTRGERAALDYDEVKKRAGIKLLEVAKNSGDKFTNPDEYMRFRQEVPPLYIDDFDVAFSILLNPLDAARIGVVQEDPFEVASQRGRREAGF